MSLHDASRFRDFEQAGWERAAPAYARYWDALTTGTVPPALDRLAVGRGTRLLDVACGTGRAAALALARRAIVTGVDFSSRMLARARRRAVGARFQRADAEALPFPDSSFDAVLCNFGLLHFARPEAALGEMARVLVPGGRLAATVWALPERMRLLGLVREAVRAAASAPSPSLSLPRQYAPGGPAAPAGPDFFHFSDPERFRAALAAAGLTEIGVEPVPLVCPVPDAETLLSMISEGTVRTAALLQAQPPDALATIRRLLSEQLSLHHHPGGPGYLLPADALLACGVR
jgi:SAM-dependent methyltransferase